MLIIGHRGASGYRPEHSRSAYELALAMGADAVEPDIVVSRDGVLVVRHENELSGTTDVADRAEFASRRTRRSIEGYDVEGWFAEDFLWSELATLRCRERIPKIRPESALFDGEERILALSEVIALVQEASREQEREIGIVFEIKHARFFRERGLAIEPLLADLLKKEKWHGSTVVECFEESALHAARSAGVEGTFVYLMEDQRRAWDLPEGPDYAAQREPAALVELARRVDGVSVDKSVILREGRRFVAHAQDAGLSVYAWTCRPENAFLSPGFRRGARKSAHGDFVGEWAQIAATGLDGVFVDHPDLGVAHFR